jgi:hypothetical protein
VGIIVLRGIDHANEVGVVLSDGPACRCF